MFPAVSAEVIVFSRVPAHSRHTRICLSWRPAQHPEFGLLMASQSPNIHYLGCRPEQVPQPLVREGDYSAMWRVRHWKSVNQIPFTDICGLNEPESM